MKSYLGSLRLFCTFLVNENVNVPVHASEISRMEGRLVQWEKRYKKPMKRRFLEKELEDLTKLVQPEEIRKFENSRLA